MGDRRNLYKLAPKTSRWVIWEAQESKRKELMEVIVGGTQQTLFKIVKQMEQSAVEEMGSTCVRDEDGIIVTEDASTWEVWRSYMEHPMNVENSWDGHTECNVKEGP